MSVGGTATCGSLTSSGSGGNQSITIANTSGGNYSSLYLNAGGVSGQIYSGANTMVVSTNTAHPLVIQCDRFNSSPAGITVSSTNDVTVGKDLTVNGVIRSSSGGYLGRANIRNVSTNSSGADFYTGFSNTNYWSIFSSGAGTLEIYRLSPSQLQCAVFGTNGYMTFLQGHGNSSDKKLKDNIEDMNENDAIQVLKSVSAKTYTRIDMNDNKKRLVLLLKTFKIYLKV